MRAPPVWAQRIIEREAHDAGREFLPVVLWRRRRYGARSSGGARPPGRNPHPRYDHFYANDPHPEQTERGHIIVTAGKERRDQKLVLLHELAHWLSPTGTHHDATFWDIAWALYRKHHVPIRYASGREAGKKGARAAYQRSVKTTLTQGTRGV